MSVAKTEEIKIRVPLPLKAAVKTLADGRYTSESEIVREAIIAYLQQRAPALLQDAPPSSNSQAVAAEVVRVVEQSVSYRKTKRKKVAK